MITSEKLFPVPTAFEKATGFRPHPSSCYRWRTSGVKGVKLETQRNGGRRVTSIEAVHRFNTKISDLDGNPETNQSRTNRQRQQAIVRAEKELDQLGI